MSLRLDWATYQSAKYAVEHWHYSKCIPFGKLVKIGVWENKKFIGVVIYGLGANNHIGSPYNLTGTECCELVRVALNKHECAVSKIISISLRLLRKKCAKLRLVVSYADSGQEHYGTIYQASNWIYERAVITSSLKINSKIYHRRSLSQKYGTASLKKIKELFPDTEEITMKCKYKYLMPLDNAMKKQIESLRKPYPKRMPLEASQRPAEDGGAIPTHTLQDFKCDNTEINNVSL